jgi:hypothetical protein
MPDDANESDRMSSDATAAIDEVISTFFAAFDNRNGRVPTIDVFDSLFTPTAVVASHSASAVSICTVKEFAQPRIALLCSGRLVSFSEWETDAQTTVLGSLATRNSRYAKSGQLDGLPYRGVGTKFFQLALVANEWRIVALSWIDDSGPA